MGVREVALREEGGVRGGEYVGVEAGLKLG